MKSFVTGFFHVTFLGLSMLLHVSAVCSFLQMNSFPLRDILWFVHLPVDGHLDCFRFGAIMNNAAMNIIVHPYLCVDRLFSFPLGRSLGVELLGSMVSLCLRNCQILFYTGCISLHSHQQCIRDPAS